MTLMRSDVTGLPTQMTYPFQANDCLIVSPKAIITTEEWSWPIFFAPLLSIFLPCGLSLLHTAGMCLGVP